jgi:hypothetical protein
MQAVASLRLLAAAAVLLLAGCAGDANEAEASNPPSPPAEVDELLAEVERARPGAALLDFVRAGARGDERRMWQRLSAPTRSRLGPTLAGFRGEAARSLEEELQALGRRHELILSQTIAPPFAVAAVRRGFRVFAAALRFEDGLWRVELNAPLQVLPLRPRPGEVVRRRTQLAAEVKAGTPIIEAGIWLDGVAFPTRGGGPTSNALTMFGESAPLSPGAHTVIAFASTAAHAAANAWSFRSVR